MPDLTVCSVYCSCHWVEVLLQSEQVVLKEGVLHGAQVLDLDQGPSGALQHDAGSSPRPYCCTA